MCPPCVRHVSAICPPYVRLGRASKPCPPCFGLAFKPCPPCATMCPPCLSLSARCLPCIRSLSAFVRVYVLALAELFSALCPVFGLCMVLPHLSDLCPLLSAVVEAFVYGLAVPLSALRLVTFAGSALVCLKVSPRICTCRLFSHFVRFFHFSPDSWKL